MKKTKILFIACLVLCLVMVSGCTPSAPSEKQILADIPDGFLTVSVDGVVQNMSINGIEIEKRQTDKKSDIVYFTLNMSNEDYKLSAYCCFQYGYYNQGGWIVDNCEIVNEQYELIPLKGISQNYADETISGYFENYSLDGDGFDGSNAWFTYSVSESHKYCSYNGLVDVNYSFYTGINCSDDPYTFENYVYANWRENVSDFIERHTTGTLREIGTVFLQIIMNYTLMFLRTIKTLLMLRLFHHIKATSIRRAENIGWNIMAKLRLITITVIWEALSLNSTLLLEKMVAHIIKSGFIPIMRRCKRMATISKIYI